MGAGSLLDSDRMQRVHDPLPVVPSCKNVVPGVILGKTLQKEYGVRPLFPRPPAHECLMLSV